MRMYVLRTLVFAIAALAMVASAAQAAHKPHRAAPAKRVLVPLPKPRPMLVYLTSDELAVAAVIYQESRNQSYMGQLLVGHSIKRRSEMKRSDFGGSSISALVCAKTPAGRSQYSGMQCPGPIGVNDKRAWEVARKAAHFVLNNYRPAYPWSEAVYYLDPKKADVEGRCWFLRELIPVGWVKDHFFYREPATEQEHSMLKQQDLPVECRPRITKLARR